MKLLDTTFLVDHQRGVPAVADYLRHHEGSGEDLATTTVNLKEVAVGKLLTEEPTPTAEEVAADFGWLDVLPYRREHALEAAAIEAGLRRTDDYEPRLSADILIAGAAKSEDAAVVTRDDDYLRRIPGVEVETY